MPTLGLLTQQIILEEDPLRISTLGPILRTATWDQEDQEAQEARGGQDWDHLLDQWGHGQCGLYLLRTTTGSLPNLCPAGSMKESNSAMVLPITPTSDHLPRLETSLPIKMAISAQHRHKSSLHTMARATQDWIAKAQLLRDSRQAMATQVGRTLPVPVLHLITTSILLHPIVKLHANNILIYPPHHLLEASTTFHRMDFTTPLAH
jgi:hypothetical protein